LELVANFADRTLTVTTIEAACQQDLRRSAKTQYPDADSNGRRGGELDQLDLAAASSRLEARLRYGLQRWARSSTSAGPGR
jgi:hypothetical protein